MSNFGFLQNDLSDGSQDKCAKKWVGRFPLPSYGFKADFPDEADQRRVSPPLSEIILITISDALPLSYRKPIN